MNALCRLLGLERPIVQAPMAGVQLGDLAVAVSEAGGLGSLPCAMLAPEAIAAELSAIRARTTRPGQRELLLRTGRRCPTRGASRPGAPRCGPTTRRSASTLPTSSRARDARRSARPPPRCSRRCGRRS